MIWALSQNVWWFVVAGMFNATLQVTENSWTCLLIEDAGKSQIINIYTGVYVAGQLAVFFAPISGLLVNSLTLVPAVRILYLFACISMSAKMIILYKYCDETKIGITRLRETAGQSIFKILSGYGAIAKKVLGSAQMRTALALNALFTITSTIMMNFFGLYATQNLMISEFFLSIFPIIRSAILLCFFFFLQSAVSKRGYKIPMITGIALYLLSHVVLLSTPASAGSGMAVVFAISYTVLEACAHGLVMPRKDSIVALFIEEDERARINSVMTMAVLAINIPFGYLSGYLSDMDRRLPFILNAIIFTSVAVLIVLSQNLSAKKMAEISD